MTQKQIKKLLLDTHYSRTGGSAEELRCAEYLQEAAKQLGASSYLEEFPIEMSTILNESLSINGKNVPCKGFLLCGSGSVEAPIYYMPNNDKLSLQGCKDHIVLLDTGVSYFTYQDLLAAGAVGILTYDGNTNFSDCDIDRKELRPYVSNGVKLPAVNVNAKTASAIVKCLPAVAKITVEQEEFMGKSRNVIAELPGSTDEWILFTAHYDSTSLSKGSYDNMSGCVGLLGILDALKRSGTHRYGCRFVFCGSEERGLRGSKAYAAAHEDALKKTVLCINLDMIGTYMGKFISCVTAEDAFCTYIKYHAMMSGWGITVRQGVYSSDSTPIADKGVPAVSFARIAPNNIAPIHNRYDTVAVMSPAQMQKDIGYLAAFSEQMADAALCPVSRTIPDNVKQELDEYLGRKRKN